MKPQPTAAADAMRRTFTNASSIRLVTSAATPATTYPGWPCFIMKNRICFPQAQVRALAKMILLAILVARPVVCFAQAPPCGGDVVSRCWTGAVNGNWSNPNNWTPVGVPQNGDLLRFDNNNNTTMVNDVVGLSVRALWMFDYDYVLSGNALTISGNGVDSYYSGIHMVGGSSHTVTIYCPLILGNDAEFEVGCSPDVFNDTIALYLSADINLNGHTLRLIALDEGGGHIQVAGSISGVGDVVVESGYCGVRSGTVEFSGTANNTFTGTLRIRRRYTDPFAVSFNKQFGTVVPGRLEIENGAVVNLSRPNQIDDNATVVINGGSQLRLNGNNETIGDLVMTNFHADAAPSMLDANVAGTFGSIGTITLRGNLTSWVFNDNVLPTIRGILSLPLGSHAFNVATPEAYAGFDMQAQIIGQGGFTKSGNAGLFLKGSNSFSGLVVVREGFVDARHVRSFGVGASGVQLDGGGMILRNLSIGTESLTVTRAGSSIEAYGNSTWSGSMTLNQQLAIYSDQSFVLPNVIIGTGGLSLSGNAIELSGSFPNTFTGATRSSCTLLTLNKTPTGTIYALSGPLIIGEGSAAPTEVRWLNDSQLNRTTASVTLHPNALMDLNTHNDTIGSLIFNGGSVQNGGAATLSLFQTVTANVANVTATINGGRLALAAGQRVFTVEDGPLEPDLSITAAVVDLGGITKNGSGTLLLNAPNSFAGPVVVNAGVLHIQNASSLGTTGAGTTVFDGATLQIELVENLAEPLNIRGNGRGGSLGALNLLPTVSVEADIVLAAASSVRVDTSYGILAGIISGTGPFTKLGAGSLQLGGSSGGNNTYTGDTLANGGMLVLFKSPFAQAVPGNLVIGTGALNSPATVRLFNPDQIWANITVNRGGLLDLFGFDEYSGDVTLNNGGDIQTGVGTLHLGPGINLFVSPGNTGSSTISGNLRVSDGCIFSVGLRLQPIFNPAPELDLQARLTDAPDTYYIGKAGAGDMRLSGANGFAANLNILAGRVTVANNTGLGGTSDMRDRFATYVVGNGSLALDGAVTINNEQLYLDSTNALVLQSLAGSNTWNGPISLFRDATITVVPPNGYLQILNTINGSGGITKLGPGMLQFWGSAANTYAGLTTVAEGVLEARRVNQISIPGDALIGDDSTSTTTARLRIQREQQFPPTANVTIRRSGLLHLFPLTATPLPTPTLRSVQGAGQIQIIDSGSSLTISNDASFEFSGAINGDGSLNKYGLGTMHMTGDGTLFGPTTIYGGTLRVDGIFDNSPITVRGGAAVRGDGVLGNVTAFDGGPNLTQRSLVLADSGFPDHQGGDLEVGNLIMSFNFGEPVSWGILSLDFFGPSPTGGNDRIVARGAVEIGNAQLAIAFEYPPREGDVLTVIEKQSAGAVTGTFAGLPQNELFTSNGIATRISYTGGDGNDITLTVTNLPLRAGKAQLSSGNLGGTLVPNDCSLLWLEVTNRSAGGLTGLRGVLRSLTAGLVVTMGESAFPNLAPNARGTNTQPFQIRTEPSFPCGGGAQLELTLTASNAPSMAVVYIFFGGSGRALEFDGFDDRVQAGTSLFSTVTNNFTIELWANPTGFRNPTAEVDTGISDITGQRYAVFPDHGYESYYDMDPAGAMDHAGAGLSIGFNGISVVEHGYGYLPSLLVYTNAIFDWTHVALVYSNKLPSLYVNGALVRTGLASTKTFVHASANLGGSIQGTNYGNYQGQLDEVRIWNTALSQTQIQANMNRSLTGGEAGLVAYYRCDEGSGLTLADSAPASPNTNGALTNGAAFVFSGVAPFHVPGSPDCGTTGGGCESCFVASGQFTSNSPTYVRALNFVGGPSICFPPKQCPATNFYSDTMAVPYLTHHFTNSTTNELCLTAQLRFGCPGAPINALGAAAYLGAAYVDGPCANYVGDTGADGTQPFSFRVPPNTNFVLLVSARDTNVACDRYTLELFGLPCPPPMLAIEREALPGKVRVHWSTAYPGWTAQEAERLGVTFGNVTQVPSMIAGRYTLTNLPAISNRFYRLKR